MSLPNSISWLAGELEGDGYFGFTDSFVVKINSCDKEVVDHVGKLMNKEVKRVKYFDNGGPSGNHNQLWRVALSGLSARDLMIKLYPHMSTRRKLQIDKSLTKAEKVKYGTHRKMKNEPLGPIDYKQISDLYWLAGIMEAEGSFCWSGTPVFQFRNNDIELINKVIKLTDYKNKISKEVHDNPNWKDSYKIHICGQDAIFQMERIYFLMSKRRQSQIDKVKELYNGQN